MKKKHVLIRTKNSTYIFENNMEISYPYMSSSLKMTAEMMLSRHRFLTTSPPLLIYLCAKLITCMHHLRVGYIHWLQTIDHEYPNHSRLIRTLRPKTQGRCVSVCVYANALCLSTDMAVCMIFLGVPRKWQWKTSTSHPPNLPSYSLKLLHHLKRTRLLGPTCDLDSLDTYYWSLTYSSSPSA